MTLDGHENDLARPMAVLDKVFDFILASVSSSESKVLKQQKIGMNLAAMSINSWSGS